MPLLWNERKGLKRLLRQLVRRMHRMEGPAHKERLAARLRAEERARAGGQAAVQAAAILILQQAIQAVQATRHRKVKVHRAITTNIK